MKERGKVSPSVEITGASNLPKGLKRFTTRTTVLWWQEVAAVILAMVCLAAIIGVLFSISDTPIAHWSMPFGMQPTTLIALLMTLSKTFLLASVATALGQLKWNYFEEGRRALADIEYFDSASRGAFGALELLYRIHWRSWIACIGALVMFLAIAMESFAQQTISLYSKRVIVGEGLASIPRTNIYDLGPGELLIIRR
jgi:hypothetical protein